MNGNKYLDNNKDKIPTDFSFKLDNNEVQIDLDLDSKNQSTSRRSNNDREYKNDLSDTQRSHISNENHKLNGNSHSCLDLNEKRKQDSNLKKSSLK